MSKLKIFSFNDIIFEPHTILPGAKKGRVEFPDKTHCTIIGGPSGCYGDGDTTFEVWYSDEEDPRGWQSREEIDKEFAERSAPWRGLI